MRDVITIRTKNGLEQVRGMHSPVPGLAITEMIDCHLIELGYGQNVVTHTLTGLGIGYFHSAEQAAGFILAIGPLTDWESFTDGNKDFRKVGRAVNAQLRAWGGELAGEKGAAVPLEGAQ